MIYVHEAQPENLRLLRMHWQKITDLHIEKLSRADPMLYDRFERVSMDLLPCLATLLDEHHDRCAQTFEATIRRVVLEQMFVLDSMNHEPSQEDFEDLVLMLVSALETVRHQLLTEGQWSENQSPPQMFG